jgi:hypothetical protein
VIAVVTSPPPGVFADLDMDSLYHREDLIVFEPDQRKYGAALERLPLAAIELLDHVVPAHGCNEAACDPHIVLRRDNTLAALTWCNIVALFDTTGQHVTSFDPSWTALRPDGMVMACY